MAGRSEARNGPPMMKRLLPLALCALLLSDLTDAAEIALEIELPDAELLLPPVSPPQLQREGTALMSESRLLTELTPLIGSNDYAGALRVLRDQRESLIERLEAGDPEGQVASRVVPGGVSYGPAAGSFSAALLFLIGHTYFALEQYLPAETALKAALAPLPDYLRVHESLGLLYLHTERFAEARVHLTRAAELGLNTAALHGALGYLNHRTQNYWGAASAFQQALVTQHDNVNWQRGLLHALNETRQYRAALALVEQMLQANPDAAELWLYRAQTSLLEGERATALASLETAIRLGDDSRANKQVAATLHMEIGSIDRAVELLKSGYAEGMDFRFVDQALGWLAQKGEWDDVRELLAFVDDDRAPLGDVQRSRLRMREASVRLQANEGRAARGALEEAVTLDPENAEALMMLGRLYRDERDYNRAEIMFRRASAYAPFRENALISLAQLAIDQESFARALELLRDVIEVNPARNDLRRNIDSLENLLLLRTSD